MISGEHQEQDNEIQSEKQFEDSRDENQPDNKQEQLNILKKIQIILNKEFHVNVARILSFELDNKSSIIVQYEINGDSLDTFLQKRRSSLSQKQITHIFSQILQGYHHLKKLNIIHNNLNIQNIFIRQIHRTHQFIVKISDYSQAIISDLAETPISQNAENKYQISQHNEKSEIYSLGIILQYLCFGTKCQNKSETTKQPISEIESVQCQEKLLLLELEQLIQKMIIDDDSKRISWDELIIHKDLQPKYLILQKRYFVDLNVVKNEEYFFTFDLKNENVNLLTKRIDTNINQNDIEFVRQMKNKENLENIIEYIEIIEEYPYTYFILEYWEQNLFEYVNDRQFQLTFAEIMNILQQILKGYQVVQALNFVQVKLNPQNIVVRWNENNQIVFKILLTGQLQQMIFNLKSPINSFHYDAPEVILGSTQNKQSDIFSLGGILHYITYGKNIYPSELQNFQDLKEYLENIKQVGFVCLKPFKYFNDLYLQLIDEMLIYSTQSRINQENLIKKVNTILQKSHILQGKIKQVQMNQQEKENFCKISNILKTPLKNSDKLKYYDELLDLNPYSQSLYYQKGQLLYGMRDQLQAIECFDQVIQINPKNQSAVRMKSYLLFTLGRREDQLKCYDDIIRIQPKLDNYRSKALALLEMKRVDELIECCDQAIQVDPKDCFAYEMKARFLLNLKLYDEAIQIYEQKFSLLPHSWDLTEIAECLHFLGKYDEANKMYDDAIQLKSDDPYNYQQKAKFLLKLGKLDEAIDILDQGIQNNLNDPTIYSVKTTFLKDLGRQDDAINCLDKGIQQNPDDVRFILLKAQFLQQVQKYQEALEYFQKAILLKPQDINNYYDKATCLQILGRYDDAIRCYDWAIQYNPHNESLFMQKGELLKDIGKFDQAIRCFNTVLQINPKSTYCYGMKGQCLERLGDYEEALNSYNSALQFDKNDSCYFCYKGKCLMEMKQYGEAIKYFKEAISICNRNSENFYNIAKCLEYLRNYDEAIDYFNQAIQLDSNQYYQMEKESCLKEQIKYQKAQS